MSQNMYRAVQHDVNTRTAEPTTEPEKRVGLRATKMPYYNTTNQLMCITRGPVPANKYLEPIDKGMVPPRISLTVRRLFSFWCPPGP